MNQSVSTQSGSALVFEAKARRSNSRAGGNRMAESGQAATDITTTGDSVGDMLRETADRLFQAYCDPTTQRAADQGTWPAALWQAIEEAALHRALVPEEAGGFGVAVTDALSLLRVAGAHALPLPLAETM